jgi:hypothetical protein
LTDKAFLVIKVQKLLFCINLEKLFVIMKRIVLIGLLIGLLTGYASAQTYTAKLSIDQIDVSLLKPGDELVIPIRLADRSGGLISGFQFFINYDHTLLRWKGSVEEPLSGIQSFHPLMPYSIEDWLFNETGFQLATSWFDPTFAGVDLRNESIIIEFIFTYQGGLEKDKVSEISFGSEVLLENGRIVKGVTELYSELLDYYVLNNENGAIINR